jgi:hypothetical protein
MSDITQNIDGFFWLSLSTIIFTSIGLFIRYSYKSKCKEVSCCCLKIVRDIDVERQEDMVFHDTKSEEKITPNTI